MAPGALDLVLVPEVFVRFGLAAEDVAIGQNAASDTVIPEPGTGALLVLGLVGLGWRFRR